MSIDIENLTDLLETASGARVIESLGKVRKLKHQIFTLQVELDHHLGIVATQLPTHVSLRNAARGGNADPGAP